MTDAYREFLERKVKMAPAAGFPVDDADIHPLLKPHQRAGVPFFFKQWGEWATPDDIEAFGKAHHGWWEEDRLDGGVQRKDWPGPMVNGVELASQRDEVFRVGKKAAGRLLDGVEHNAYPEQRA
jgi:hypothetical protein